MLWLIIELNIQEVLPFYTFFLQPSSVRKPRRHSQRTVRAVPVQLPLQLHLRQFT